MYALALALARTRARAPALVTLALSLTSTRYALARLADPDIQAEAATVIANVTSTIYEAQMQVSTLTTHHSPLTTHHSTLNTQHSFPIPFLTLS